MGLSCIFVFNRKQMIETSNIGTFRRLIKEILKKPTLFSILSIVGILIGIPFGIYQLTLNGGQSLGGVLLLIGVFFLIIVLAVDRGLVSKIKPLKLSLFELLFAVIILGFHQTGTKRAFVDLDNYKENYFIVIYNNGHLKDNKVSYKFIFNKEIEPYKNYVVIPKSIKDEYDISVSLPKSWTSSEMKPEYINGYKVEFYNSEKKVFKESEINAIIKELLKNIKQ